MRIRGVYIPPLMTHLFAFLFGTVVVIPWESECSFDMNGILLAPGPSLERRLSEYDERTALYILIREQGVRCRLSDQVFFVWRDPVSERNYVQIERSVGAVKLIERMISRRGFELSERGEVFPACQNSPQVSYGF